MCQELNSEITQLDTEAGLMGWSYDVFMGDSAELIEELGKTCVGKCVFSKSSGTSTLSTL